MMNNQSVSHSDGLLCASVTLRQAIDGKLNREGARLGFASLNSYLRETGRYDNLEALREEAQQNPAARAQLADRLSQEIRRINKNASERDLDLMKAATVLEALSSGYDIDSALDAGHVQRSDLVRLAKTTLDLSEETK